ncbi:SEL1-like repeat protein [Phreatobacter stygius]|uniref:SEL1-like repeat protein n=1 Tax=Phreatobacter stygius TaxID=1940610 RepID=A0A4D7B7F9_9HYPH|nr:SEL1-like repeat protein [Phreatobacter stygius]
MTALELADRPPRELGMLYAAGRVVPRDLVAAHMWLNIAALKGDREAARQRQEIAGEMSKDEIARALAGARAWLDRQIQEPIA